MGNCQANYAAAAVIQHPNGGILRLCWPTTVDQVMKNYPGHHVAQITLCIANGNRRGSTEGGGAANFRFTRIRLLKHKDLLLIGHVYRLITSHEVSEALKARRHARIQKIQAEIRARKKQSTQGNDAQKRDQEVKYGKQRRSGWWKPSLQSISELRSSQVPSCQTEPKSSALFGTLAAVWKGANFTGSWDRREGDELRNGAFSPFLRSNDSKRHRKAEKQTAYESGVTFGGNETEEKHLLNKQASLHCCRLKIMELKKMIKDF